MCNNIVGKQFYRIKPKFDLPKVIIEITFWKLLYDTKLKDLKYNDSNIEIIAFYDTEKNNVRFNSNSLNYYPKLLNGNNKDIIHGNLYVYNSIEDLIMNSENINNSIKYLIFQNISKMYEVIEDNPQKVSYSSLLYIFGLLVFLDFKNSEIYYKICFPYLYYTKDIELEQCKQNNKLLGIYYNQNLYNSLHNMKLLNMTSLLISNIESMISKKLIAKEEYSNDIYMNIPWFYSTLLCYLRFMNIYFSSDLIRNIDIKVFLNNSLLEFPLYDLILCNGYLKPHNCLVLENIDKKIDLADIFNVNLKCYLDPLTISKNMTELNIELIKWRLLPNFKPDSLSYLKILIIGSGTLGCAISRILVGWGVKNFTFIDNSIVNYNNPTRQCLYIYNDAIERKYKALTAAERLKEISPNISSNGIVLNIPILGDTTVKLDEFIDSWFRLKSLISSHDVTFLLTDTRESRWMPSTIISLLNRYTNSNSNSSILGLTVALGFDSFLVMRHTTSGKEIVTTNILQSVNEKKFINNYGCYFCGDFSINSNSVGIRNKPIDQQCSVIRMGNSYIASSLAVELLVALSQHPLRWDTYHISYKGANNNDVKDITKSSEISLDEENSVGYIPQCIRGFIDKFYIVSYSTQVNENCISCSKYLLDKLYNDEVNILTNIWKNPDYIESICGMESYKESLKDIEIEQIIDNSGFIDILNIKK